jgi:hypothetical protein
MYTSSRLLHACRRDGRWDFVELHLITSSLHPVPVNGIREESLMEADYSNKIIRRFYESPYDSLTKSALMEAG